MGATLIHKEEDLIIKITADGMKSFLTINSHDDKVSSLDLNTIMSKLWEKGVKFGIKEQIIKILLEKKIYNRSILIAEGIPPQDGKDAVIESRFKKKDKVDLRENLEGKIDFRDLGLIDVVHAGDVLVTKIPPTQGVCGKKVTGEEIPAKDGRDISILEGENTYFSSDRLVLFAAVDGYVFWQEDRIGVKTVYEVAGDVDRGNIYFVGDVKVKGDVKEGFTVNTKGNIEIGGGVENATLIAEGNIMVLQGIIGKVVANGDLKCKFIQNAEVKVKGNVIVYDAILYSNVDAGNGVYVLGGKKGVIIGGRIRAKNEVNAKNIGNMSEVPTEIVVDTGKVSVVDTLWPGVKLTIGDVPFLTKSDYRYVTFVNKSGSLEQEGYQKPKIKTEELLFPEAT